ncbi:Detected protein of unknown function [Hibiscus syriacus]|uniref:NAB domain-containing protein n=1 Tax=Hibiscus syriacus TaxID=106335 RepID=A0A6A2XHK5_HIBSY|nr:Detected protein of unknown function [Hibiscus syriacus]
MHFGIAVVLRQKKNKLGSEKGCCKELLATHIHGGGLAISSEQSSQNGWNVIFKKTGIPLRKEQKCTSKKRPELIRFVEESYRAYRALAERYNHLSSDLQTANTAIASVCPDQIQFSMDYGGKYGSPRSPIQSPDNLIDDISMVPEPPDKDLITPATKKMLLKKSTKDATIAVAKSEWMKAEGIKEIDRLHKQVLALQTEKEFAKSCYESGLAKYWEIDNEINQMQQKICNLEDEFGEGRVIEDNEARNVMAATALRSCEETLVRLQEKQERSVMETHVEQKRIEDAREKLFVLKNEFVLNEFGPENPPAGEAEECEEMEDRIDELVNNVLNLETSVSFQSALVKRLRLRKMEEKLHWVQDLNRIVEDRNNELQTQFTEARSNIDCLSVKMHNVKIDEVESSENKINDCDKMPKKENAGHEFEDADVSERKNSPADVKSKLESEKQKNMNQHASDGCGVLQSAKPEMAAVSGLSRKEEDALVSAHEGRVSHETSKHSEKYEDQIKEQVSSMTMLTLSKIESNEHERGPGDEPEWKQLFSEGMDNIEQNIVMEYTKILRNYWDTKKQLMAVETNNQNRLSDIMLQLKELKNINAMKDEEILSLRQELNLSRTCLSQNNNTDQYSEPRVSTEKSIVVKTSLVSPSEEEVKEDIGVMLNNQSQTLSEIEEKLCMKIDELLNENLDCWFRFKTAVKELSKFENGVNDIQAETELNAWVERSILLKDEPKNRFSSLCDIQEEITKEFKASAADDDLRFTSYQASKFQSEISKMKQENNKVAEELQAGLDNARTLQLEVERTLAKLTEDLELSGSKINQSGQRHLNTRNRIPLRSFIFGFKPKKQKTSIFDWVHPALHRKYIGLRSLYSSK